MMGQETAKLADSGRKREVFLLTGKVESEFNFACVRLHLSCWFGIERMTAFVLLLRTMWRELRRRTVMRKLLLFAETLKLPA